MNTDMAGSREPCSWIPDQVRDDAVVVALDLGLRPTDTAFMTLKLYYHPLSSFCQKALIAFYERAVPFEGVIVDLSDAEQRAALAALWPIGKFPVLRDEERGVTVPEASLIVEYLDRGGS